MKSGNVEQQGAKAFVLVNIEIGLEREVIKSLEAMPEVKEAFRIYGVYDVIIKIESEDVESLNKTISSIRKLRGINNTMTLLPMEGFEKQ